MMFGREWYQLYIGFVAFCIFCIGMIWSTATIKRARQEKPLNRWPPAWKWVAAGREIVLACFFLWVAVFYGFGVYEWQIHAASITSVLLAKLYVFRRWQRLSFPDPTTPIPKEERA